MKTTPMRTNESAAGSTRLLHRLTAALLALVLAGFGGAAGICGRHRADGYHLHQQCFGPAGLCRQMRL